MIQLNEYLINRQTKENFINSMKNNLGLDLDPNKETKDTKGDSYYQFFKDGNIYDLYHVIGYNYKWEGKTKYHEIDEDNNTIFVLVSHKTGNIGIIADDYYTVEVNDGIASLIDPDANYSNFSGNACYPLSIWKKVDMGKFLLITF